MYKSPDITKNELVKKINDEKQYIQDPEMKKIVDKAQQKLSKMNESEFDANLLILEE